MGHPNRPAVAAAAAAAAALQSSNMPLYYLSCSVGGSSGHCRGCSRGGPQSGPTARTAVRAAGCEAASRPTAAAVGAAAVAAVAAAATACPFLTCLDISVAAAANAADYPRLRSSGRCASVQLLVNRSLLYAYCYGSSPGSRGVE